MDILKGDKMTQQKTCYIISPTGEFDTPIRIFAIIVTEIFSR